MRDCPHAATSVPAAAAACRRSNYGDHEVRADEDGQFPLPRRRGTGQQRAPRNRLSPVSSHLRPLMRRDRALHRQLVQARTLRPPYGSPSSGRCNRLSIPFLSRSTSNVSSSDSGSVGPMPVDVHRVVDHRRISGSAQSWFGVRPVTNLSAHPSYSRAGGWTLCGTMNHEP